MDSITKVKNAVDTMISARNRQELLENYNLAQNSLHDLFTELRNQLRDDDPIQIAACKPIDRGDLTMRFKYHCAGEDFLNEYFPGMTLPILFDDFSSVQPGQYSKYSYAFKNPMCEDFFMLKLFREPDDDAENAGNLSIEICNRGGIYVGPSIDCGRPVSV